MREVDVPENSEDGAADEIGALMDSFIERYRRGERGLIPEYERRHPEMATRIREAFPALELLERDPAEESEVFPGLRPPHASTPQHLGEYRLIREVGRGGMGLVYEAEQVGLARRVALKLLPYHALLEEKQIERFHREAQAAARLHHPNIVPVFGVGQDRGIRYYVMQFIEGRSFEQVLSEVRRNPEGQGLPGESSSADFLRTAAHFRMSARVILEAAEAMAYAHAEGVLHRDLKPSNLLLDGSGRTWVTDFGLAQVEGSDRLTASGDAVGTLRYMAPERFKGWSDARSDVYSLGLTLYEALTLSHAFHQEAGGDRASLIHQILSEAPPRPRKLDRRVPRDLETIVLTATEKEPSRRYASAADLAQDLRRFLEGRPILARRVGAPERAWLWCRRNPALSVAVAAIAVLVLGFAAYAAVSALSYREALWGSYLEQARARRWSGQPGRRFETLEVLEKAASIRPSLEIRNEAIAALALLDVRVRVRWQKPLPSPNGRVWFDPGLRWSAVSDGHGNIEVEDLSSGRVLARLPSPGLRVWVRDFSPDRRYLAGRYHHPHGQTLGKALVWDLSREKVVLEVECGSPGGAMAFTHDSSRFLVALADGTLQSFELPSAQRAGDLSIAPGGVWAMAFDPTASRLALTNRDPTAVEVRSYPNGDLLWRNEKLDLIYSVAWSPDGTVLAAGGEDRLIHILSAADGSERSTLKGHGGHVVQVAYAGTGDLLASSAYDATTRLWNPWNGTELVRIPGRSGPFGHDGRTLGLTEYNGGFGLYEVEPGTEFRRIPPPTGVRAEFTSSDLSPDGRLLATSSDNGVILWDLDGCREAARIPIGLTWSVQFHSADGTLVTCGAKGLLWWVVDRSARGVVKVGPPRSLWNRNDLAGAALSGDGVTVAVSDNGSHGFVFKLATPEQRLDLNGLSRLAWPQVSPNGKWVAAGNWQGTEVKVWDAETGNVVFTVEGKSARVYFSPDGKWLIRSRGPDYTFFETAGWKAAHRIPRQGTGSLAGIMTFTADSTQAAIMHTPDRVRLVDPNSGNELATLDIPGGVRIADLKFSSDGARLVIVLGDNSIRVWDLRMVRARLEAMRLDWVTPPRVPEPKVEPEPLRVEVDLGDLAR